MNEPVRVIAVDFDGTLCEDRRPYIGEPKTNVITAIKEAQKNGAKIILWTCRGGRMLHDAVEACRQWGIEFDAVNENVPELIDLYHHYSRKVDATEYWDDKAVRIE